MKRQVVFGVITAVLVLVLAVSVGGVVLGQPQHGKDTGAKAYLQLEEVYVAQIRELLEAEGMASAGLTLTYERDRDGSRCYTLLVHHHKLENLNEAKREELEVKMEEYFFSGEKCSVCAQLVWQM